MHKSFIEYLDIFKEKGQWLGTIQEVLEYPGDVIPLFRYKVDLTDIDFTRIDTIESIVITFKVKT